MISRFCQFQLGSWLAASLSAIAAESSPAKKPVFLYSLYYQAPGENRYPPNGSYQELLENLRATFEVRISDSRPTDQLLRGVSVVLLANPNEHAVGTNPPPPHLQRAEAQTLARFVERGGGLIALGNQEGHNLEVTDFNQLFGRFGLQFTNHYHDAKRITIDANAAPIGGLHWAYYTGNEIQINPQHRAHPRALVTNQPEQPTETHQRNDPGILLAVATPGRGHVVLATDAGWLTHNAFANLGIGGVIIRDHDNREIFRRLSLWAAGRKID